jgi:hypothetical protein
MNAVRSLDPVDDPPEHLVTLRGGQCCNASGNSASECEMASYQHLTVNVGTAVIQAKRVKRVHRPSQHPHSLLDKG